MTKGLFVALLLASALSLSAQAPGNTQLHSFEPLAPFPLGSADALSIQTPALPVKPFTVTGPRGALLGQQDGTYEAWIFPWKILSDMRITAQMKDYAVPIDVNEQAATIDVQPDHTTITFSHANFTIREILLTPQHAPEGAGALVLYQIQAVRPLTLTFSFTPEMKRMWPAPSDNRPSAEWVQTGPSGFYILHSGFSGTYRGTRHSADRAGHPATLPGTAKDLSVAVRASLRSKPRFEKTVSSVDDNCGDRKGIRRDIAP